MRLKSAISLAFHEFITGPYLLGAVLLLLGLLTIEPMLTMAGAVILIGMVAISLRVRDNAN